MDDFETSDIIALQHAIHNTSGKFLRKFIESLSDCDLVSLLDCYLQRYLPQRHNFDLWRANTEIPKQSQLIDSIHTLNLQNINNKSTNQNTCNHDYNILKSMQNTFGKKYYQNPKPKARQHSLLLKILPPCLLSTIISFLSFNDRNLNKSVCFDFYQSCKDKNLIGNHHSLITDKQLVKLQKNEIDIRRFIHCKHLEFCNIGNRYKFEALLIRIIAGDSRNNHITHRSQCNYVNYNYCNNNWPKSSLTKGNYQTLTIKDYSTIYSPSQHSLMNCIVDLGNKCKNNSSNSNSSINSDNINGIDGNKISLKSKGWMGELKENYINSLKGIRKLIWNCGGITQEGKIDEFISLMPNIENIIFVDGTDHIFPKLQTPKNIYKAFFSQIRISTIPCITITIVDKLQHLDMDIRHGGFWNHFDSAQDHFNCNPLYLVRFCKNLKIFRLKITSPTTFISSDFEDMMLKSMNLSKDKHKHFSKSKYKHHRLVEMIQDYNNKIKNNKAIKLKDLRVIDIDWTHDSRMLFDDDINHGKYKDDSNKMVFELIHESMNFLLNLSIKKNIREFGYQCRVGSITFFDEMTTLAGQCKMLKSLKIDCMLSNCDIAKILLNNISKSIDHLNLVIHGTRLKFSSVLDQIKTLIESNRLLSIS